MRFFFVVRCEANRGGIKNDILWCVTSGTALQITFWGLRMTKPSLTSLRMFWREFAMEISLICYQSMQRMGKRMGEVSRG